MSKTVIWIIVGVVAAIVLILVLIGLCFNAAYRKDQKRVGEDYLWADRRRTKLGLPWTFTKYSLSEDRMFVQKGFIKTTYDEVRLYRILDVKMTQTLGQKIFSIGTVEIHSSDKGLGCFSLINVKHPMKVKELISEKVEQQRDMHRVYSRENMIDMDENSSYDDAADDMVQ